MLSHRHCYRSKGNWTMILRFVRILYGKSQGLSTPLFGYCAISHSATPTALVDALWWHGDRRSQVLAGLMRIRRRAFHDFNKRTALISDDQLCAHSQVHDSAKNSALYCSPTDYRSRTLSRQSRGWQVFGIAVDYLCPGWRQGLGSWRSLRYSETLKNPKSKQP
jgi:hypothetical protein